MPTFTAIALDRLLEPGPSKSVESSVPRGKLPNSKPPIPNLEKRNAKPAAERTGPGPTISPALYATPEAIPLPDSPSSFPPSPYIINHKARGPRLLKSFSEDDVSSCQKALNQEKNTNGDADIKVASLRKFTSASFSTPEPVEDKHADDAHGSGTEMDHVGPVLVGHESGWHVVDPGRGRVELSSSNKESLERQNDLLKAVAVSAHRDGEGEDFYDPGDSMSFASNSQIGEDAAAEFSQKLATPVGEFYDACDELSSDSGMQTSVRDVEAELSEIRLSLLTEIEKRKQAEEAISYMQSCWQKVREQLAQVGVTLPADTAMADEGWQPDINLAEELCHQFDIVRFVSDCFGRGIAKAEIEAEMEAKLEAKSFEIARLSDRLHYYEAVNREMSQRNQEAIEEARRDRQRRRKRQRWIWGSIAATITLGSAALAWSYLPHEKASSSTETSLVPEADVKI